jgi:hypothetical protein
MPMTNPGGGVSSLKALTDVSIASEDAGIDQNLLVFNNATVKWAPLNSLSLSNASSNWNPNDKSTRITLSNNNLTATINTSNNGNVRANTARRTGKYYCEFTATTIGSAGFYGFGICLSSYSLTANFPVSNLYAGYIASGSISYNNVSSLAMPAIAAGNVVSMAVDFGNNALWFRVQGGNWNNNAANNPATNTGGVTIANLTTQGSLFPFWSGWTTNDATTANFGASAFTYAVPSGFQAWDIMAPQSQTVGASPVALTAPGNGSFIVSGGTVTAITLTRGAAAAVNLGSLGGSYSVLAGDILTVTYSAAPSVVFLPVM